MSGTSSGTGAEKPDCVDACAWALYANGKFAEARKLIEAAMAPGIRDAKILYHAGAIAMKLNNRATAQRLFEQSLELNPVSDVALTVRKSLGRKS